MPSGGGSEVSEEKEDEVLTLDCAPGRAPMNWAYPGFVMSRYSGAPPFFVRRDAVGTISDDELISCTGGSWMEATFHWSLEPGSRLIRVRVPGVGLDSRSCCFSVSG